MVEYSKVNCKLKNVQLHKLKKAVKSNEGATLRLGIRNFNKNERPHELLLTTRQNMKLRNALNNNSATDIKLSKAQIKKIIQSGGFLGKLLSKLTGPLMKVAMPLAKTVLAPLEALSNCDNFTVIIILYNNDVLTWDYKDNNKYQVTMS